ncbi:uncharacterized protein LOC121050492 [Rosa chinensis]|uniref:uncharacterized protein LOC121050492 n=1 Tax=Rosa chinensis TaxID=74649 RepID=UPI001AD90BB8|nr:uncharacterized protein LOC121050492 [Rosa chinensis]
MWKMLLALTALWDLLGCEFLTVAEVLFFCELTYNERKKCGGTVKLTPRPRAPKLLEHTPDSSTTWRAAVCVSTEGWEYDMRPDGAKVPRFRVPSKFQAIKEGWRPKLTNVERQRVCRVHYCWEHKSCLDLRVLSHWSLLIRLRLTREPGKCNQFYSNCDLTL